MQSVEENSPEKPNLFEEESYSQSIHKIHASLFVPVVKIIMTGLLAMFIYLLLAMVFSGSTVLSAGGSTISQSVAVFWTSGAVLFIVLIIYFAMVLYMILSWNKHYYVINSQAVLMYDGIIFSKSKSYDMAGVESIEVDQGLIGKVFNFGTLKLYNPRLEKEITFHRIPDPNKEAGFIHGMHPNPVAFIVNKSVGNGKT
jgi:membrane protein YdbS with pleckstrin-like domain